MSKLLIIAATVAAIAATPASAKDHSWPIGNDQYHVYYTDLNMNDAKDRAEMLARIEKVAGKLCAKLIATNRPACVADTVRQTANGPRGHFVMLAMAERGDVKLAAR